MQPVAAWADWIRANRRPVSADNPFLAFEHMASDMIANGLEAWGKARDAMSEQIFLSAYGAPWLQAMMGLHADQATASRRVERDPAREAAAAQLAAELALHIETGGLAGGRGPRAALRPFAGRHGRRTRVSRAPERSAANCQPPSVSVSRASRNWSGTNT